MLTLASPMKALYSTNYTYKIAQYLCLNFKSLR